jgi:hypothetical protein
MTTGNVNSAQSAVCPSRQWYVTALRGAACAAKVVAPDGRPLRFFNLGLSGGLAPSMSKRIAIRWLDQPIDGVKCFADEARFSGIVIQTFHEGRIA